MSMLSAFTEKKPIIVYDTREARSFVLRHLKTFKDIVLVEKQLEIADYLVEGEKATIAVERKTASDFLNSISDGRIFEQIEALKSYEDARIIIEGSILTNAKLRACYAIDSIGKALNEKFESRTHPRTMWATRFFIHPHSLTSIFKKIQDEGIRIIPSGSAHDTADLLHFWAIQKEKEEQKIVIKRKPKTGDSYIYQIFLVSALPGIGAKQAEKLLQTFGSPLHVFSAFLQYPANKFPVDGIGEKKIKRIREILKANFAAAQKKLLLEHEIRERINELRELMKKKEKELEKKHAGEIKKLLKEKGLKVSGRKKELIERYLHSLSIEERADLHGFLKKYKELLELIKSGGSDIHKIPEDIVNFYEEARKHGIHSYSNRR